ncbi:RuvC family protein [Achromobacter xylosoxidans]|uniref:crossover junction endodeoxyribonuclease RuvC n=1 Tax=Alcaligenes xylosoxydans xylosoxydans TaxID=85698 RepID=UPI0011DC83EC|nr:crossover junction endodeoxyribonuclease RuvC [Achromobacter xylosoxidans]
MTSSQNLTDAYDPMAGTLAGSYARAGAPTAEPGKINIGPVDPWAHPGAETPRAVAETRTNAGFDPGAGAGPAPALSVNILALDLGTKLGWALLPRGGQIAHGTESFAPRKSWSPGQRWQRFRTFLHEVVSRHNVHLIAYEDVKRHIGTDAAHAYGAFLALTELVADSHRARLAPVGVGTIKKHWTGKGNADKAAMLAEARARGFRPESDNDADALAILSWAMQQEARS